MDLIKNICIFVVAIIGLAPNAGGLSTIPPRHFFLKIVDNIKIVDMKSKKCTKCNEIKSYDEYYKDKRLKNGLCSICKLCINKTGREYKRTKRGVISQIYSKQRSKSKEKSYPMPTYSKKQLINWLFAKPLFHKLYDNWKASGFKKLLKPSCDRPDDYKGYSLNNLQLMTWGENKAKGESDMRNGINNKQSKAVIGTHMSTGKNIEFYSTREAERQTGIRQGRISVVCLKRYGCKTAGGYKWRHKY